MSHLTVPDEERGPREHEETGAGRGPPAEPGDTDPRRWPALGLLSVSVLLAMSPWFTASAAGDAFRTALGLTGGQVAWLTGAVQIGFVAGTLVAAILNLADIVPSRTYFATCAVLAAGANTVLLFPTGFEGLLALRFLTGFFLAGVYPPAMKMVATWFRSARGMAIGTVVGALTVGKAAPFLLRAGAGDALEGVVLGASLAALAGGLLVLALYRDGPAPFPRRAFQWDLVATVLRHRETRLATWGYLGHMWELYAMWSTIGLFFAAHLTGRVPEPAAGAGFLAFVVIAAGGAGAVGAGVLADRVGRERVAGAAMAVSGTVALTLGWLVGAPTWLVAGLALVWGITVVADSAQFSALVTEVAPPHAAGTALTLQTSLGFLLTTVTIQAVPWMAGTVGWGPAFAILAAGPAAGIWAMARLAAVRGRPL